MPESKPPYFAEYTEIRDAADQCDIEHAMGAPVAATAELAKLLHRFDGQIDDDWRAQIIAVGGGLHRLSKLIAADDTAEEIRRHGR